jgi:hypothetical protein
MTSTPPVVEGARLTLAGLPERARQRRLAARRLLALARHAGGPRLVATLAVHAIAGLLPIAFVVFISVAVQRLSEGALGPT